jgi:hypothetical protein
MIRFSDHLVEKTFLQSPQETINRIDEVLKNINQLKGQPLLWRGFKGAKPISGIEMIDNDRGKSFYGAASQLSTDIVKHIGIKNITFAICSAHQAEFFGTPYIIVPLSKMTPWHSDAIPDIWGIASKTVRELKTLASIDHPYDSEGMFYSVEKKIPDDLKEEIAKYFASTYKKEIRNQHEVLIDVESYALIDPVKILDIVPKWIEDKMGYSKSITITDEERALAMKYMYSPAELVKLNDEDAKVVRSAISKYNANISNRSGSTNANMFQFKFGENLNSYDDIKRFMEMFKSYVEFMIKKN